MAGNPITIPRPAPDQVVLAACDEGGAICWVMVSKATLTGGGDIAAQLVPILGEGQALLHESRA